MRYLSVCSGIEAASVAWEPLGWEPVLFSEIEAFPRAVLKHRLRARDARRGVRAGRVPLWGDFTTIRPRHLRRLGIEPAIDLLVGGTPCQSFSVAGLRKGLDDARGNLALEFLLLARRLRPRWVVWENVPGVLSSNGGRDFGAFLGGLAELGYGFAYRILDAQHFGVPQRRRRVFVVGHLGDWRRAAAVLFERHSLSGHPAPRREAGEGVAGTLAPGAHPDGFNGRDAESGMLIGYQCHGSNVGPMGTLRAGNGNEGGGVPFIAFQATGNGLWREGLGPLARSDDNGTNQMIAHTLRADGFDASEDGTGRGTPLVPIAFPWQQGGSMGFSSSEGEARHSRPAGENAERGRAEGMGNSAYAVRRILPVEAERLQGFPDDYTLVPYRGKPAKDGPRYKALGNSMAVPVMAWIGERIQMVEDLAPLPERCT